MELDEILFGLATLVAFIIFIIRCIQINDFDTTSFFFFIIFLIGFCIIMDANSGPRIDYPTLNDDNDSPDEY